MNDMTARLAGHAFFTGLDPRLVAEVAELTTTAHFAARQWVARSGERATVFHAVTAGRAGIEITAAGREPLLVATVHPGDVLGWSWFVEPHRWHFDVIALDDLETLAIDAEGLRVACAANHELGYQLARRLTRVVASRLDATRHQLVDVYGRAE